MKLPTELDALSIAVADVATQALVGASTILVAIAALYVTLRAHRTDKENFLTEIRREWESLSPEWNRCLMYLYGADQYYHSVERAERAAHSAMVRRFVASRPVGFNNEEWEWVRDHRPEVARLGRFLSYASDALITGRWTLREAYALLGPYVGRHYGALLWISHRLPIDKVPFANPGGDEGWRSSLDQLPEFNMYDYQDSLVVLAFVLRAEQCRRGDTHAHFVPALALQLHDGWGTSVRRALHRSSRSRGRWWPRASLRRAIHRAEHPWKRSAFEFEKHAIVKAHQVPLFQRPYESRVGNIHRIESLRRKAEF